MIKKVKRILIFFILICSFCNISFADMVPTGPSPIEISVMAFCYGFIILVIAFFLRWIIKREIKKKNITNKKDKNFLIFRTILVTITLIILHYMSYDDYAFGKWFLIPGALILLAVFAGREDRKYISRALYIFSGIILLFMVSIIAVYKECITNGIVLGLIIVYTLVLLAFIGVTIGCLIQSKKEEKVETENKKKGIKFDIIFTIAILGILLILAFKEPIVGKLFLIPALLFVLAVDALANKMRKLATVLFLSSAIIIIIFFVTIGMEIIKSATLKIELRKHYVLIEKIYCIDNIEEFVDIVKKYNENNNDKASISYYENIFENCNGAEMLYNEALKNERYFVDSMGIENGKIKSIKLMSAYDLSLYVSEKK